MPQDSSQWPVIVRAAEMKTRQVNPAVAVEFGLYDATGQRHTLKLSSAAALHTHIFLSTYAKATHMHAPMIQHQQFRIDSFAAAIEQEVLPDRLEDRDRLSAFLSARVECPKFSYGIDEATGSFKLGVIDELQLDQLLQAIRSSGIFVTARPAQVAYREEITQATEIDYVHKKQSEGAGEFAQLKLDLLPTPGDYGYTFNALRLRGVLGDNFVNAIERGVRSGMSAGVRGGYPVIGARVMVVDAAAHDIDSTADVFEAAARGAVRAALGQGQPQIVEPLMKVEIVTPEQHVGAVVKDLTARGGATDGRGRHGRDGIALSAYVPAVGLLGYANALASISENRARFSAQFDYYVPIPSSEDPAFRPAAAVRANAI